MPLTELRLFISSTFRDLQDERDHLVKKIFPEIRALCRSRGIAFTEVDLRWGLTDQDVVLGQAIGACLNEIDRCRPYFIGITGDRYGWVPALHDIYKDPELLVRYPWVESAVADGASITDLEYRHAALNDPFMAMDSARFYFRRNRHRPVSNIISTDGRTDDAARLENLQKRVRESGLSVQEFRDPGTLGEMVYDALIEIIGRDFTDARPPSSLDTERARHQAFAASRRHAYIPNANYLQRFNEFINSDERALVVHAESGAGKSALLAYWVGQYRGKHPEAFVVEHYVGIGAGRVDHLEIIRHVMLEIRERCGVVRELPTTTESFEQELPAWLAEIQKEQCLLVIDGLNQLHGAELGLAWLPVHIPLCIKLIVSSSASRLLTAIHDRGWSLLAMLPLTESEREAVAVRFLSEYRKALRQDLVKRIATEAKCAQPLFLRTLLEELRLFGRHEQLEEMVEDLLATSGIEELFQWVLTRLEEDFGPKTVRMVMTLIWASRYGMSENDIVAIGELSRLKVSEMAAGLDYHLLRSDGRLMFFHDYLRDAVECRYLAEDASKYRTHLAIADYLEGQRMGEPVVVDLPWHLHKAGEVKRLRDVIGRRVVLEAFVMKRANLELLGYWLACGGVKEMEQCYLSLLSAVGNRNDEPERDAQLLVGVCELYHVSGIAHAAIPYARHALAIHEASLGVMHIRVARTACILARLLNEIGNYEEADVLLRRALTVCEEAVGSKHAMVATSMHDLAWLLFKTGKYAEAEQLYRRAQTINEELFGAFHPVVAQSLGNLVSVLLTTRRYSEAEPLIRRVLVIYESAFGPDHSNMAAALSKLARVRFGLGGYAESETLLLRALAIDEAAVGMEHPRTAFTLQVLGDLYLKQGNTIQARSYLERALAIRGQLFGAWHIETAWTTSSLGRLCGMEGNYERAYELYKHALGIFDCVLGAENVTTQEIRQELEELDGKRDRE